METQKRTPWRRWIVLVLKIAGFILGGIFVPVQPEITVAAEKLIEEPIVENFLGLGPLYLVNTLPTLAVTIILLLVIAFFANRSLKKSQNTDLVPHGIGNVMEAILEMLYNLTEGSAGIKWARAIFPWFATIMIYVLFANLLKLIPGFESIGVLRSVATGHPFSGAFLMPGEVENGRILVPFFGAMDFLVGLLELISEISKILSFAFRLFGNMFAGIVLVAIVAGLLGRISILPAMIMMFELFVGVIQAFVFGMLTMVFMAQATQGHGGEEHTEAHSEAHEI